MLVLYQLLFYVIYSFASFVNNKQSLTRSYFLMYLRCTFVDDTVVFQCENLSVADVLLTV